MDNFFSPTTAQHTELIFRFIVSLTLGFLIGLEREFSHKKEEQFAGVRTHTLVTLAGFLSAFLSDEWNLWIFITALAAVVTLVIVSYIYSAKAPDQKGGTSEITVIITFLLGAIVYLDYILFAVVITVCILLLLAFKPNIHLFISKMSRKELLAIIQFVVITAVVLPFLPDKAFGPYDAWNMKDIWQMVALVSGINLLSYLLAKTYGNKGTLIGGLTGGMVSSTFVTLSFSRKSRESSSPASTLYIAIAIISACSIMFPRVLLEVYVVNRTLINDLIVPVLLMCAAGFLSVFFIYRFAGSKDGKVHLPLQNPLNFIVAVKFALIYALIQWAIQYLSLTYGSGGTYIAALLSGITDMDAITISMANSAETVVSSTVAVNAILLAAMSNTLTKLIILLILGNTALRKTATPAFIAILLTGGIYLTILLR